MSEKDTEENMEDTIKQIASQVADDSVESCLEMAETLAMLGIHADPVQLWEKDQLAFGLAIPHSSFTKLKSIVVESLLK